MKIIECPRDAMQGIHEFIPTQKKINYINSLLNVGFDTIDFGSFVSPKAIPQLQDTAEVLAGLDLSSTSSKLLAIIANKKGAETAVQYDEINYLGYPFSISETFQLRNTNSTIAASEQLLDEILALVSKNNKELVVYLSMAFGNPYGDAWNANIVGEWTEKMVKKGIKILALSDTIGSSDVSSITYLFKHLIPSYPDVEIGAHLHTRSETALEKLKAAYENGCRRFDGAINGLGGCPMAKDDLTGNMPTESILSYAEANNITLSIDHKAFSEAKKLADFTFPKYNEA